jgi:hypothetical protein
MGLLNSLMPVFCSSQPHRPRTHGPTSPVSAAPIYCRGWINSPRRLSRQLCRLRDIGVIKRVRGTYRYYLTRIGGAATAALPCDTGHYHSSYDLMGFF